MFAGCGKEAVCWLLASSQPPILGVGRYGESVPLLRITSNSSAKPRRSQWDDWLRA